jgi:hypothetical protein
MFLLEAQLEAGAELAWPQDHVERGVHVVEGAWVGANWIVAAMQMAVQTGPSAPPLKARVASASCCSAVRRWMASGICGGTSWPARASGSSKRRRTGGAAFRQGA